MKVENVYIKISLRLGSDAEGKPTIETSDCSTRISKVRVHFSGKLGYVTSLRVLELPRVTLARLPWDGGFQALA